MTDESYLKAEGLSTKDVKGVVSISGVYRVDAFDLRLRAKNEWLDVARKSIRSRRFWRTTRRFLSRRRR